jgi:hypothetical protein
VRVRIPPHHQRADCRCGTEVRPFISGDRRELYANIEGPETAQTILRHPKSPHLQLFSRQLHHHDPLFDISN